MTLLFGDIFVCFFFFFCMCNLGTLYTVYIKQLTRQNVIFFLQNMTTYDNHFLLPIQLCPDFKTKYYNKDEHGQYFILHTCMPHVGPFLWK